MAFCAELAKICNYCCFRRRGEETQPFFDPSSTVAQPAERKPQYVQYKNSLGKIVTVLPSQFTPWTERGKPKRESFLEDGMANQQLTFEEVTSTEWHLIQELHVVKQPKTIGTGNDAQTGWRKGEGEPCMKVLAIWKVNHSEVLEKYIEEIELLQSREEDYWVETV